MSPRWEGSGPEFHLVWGGRTWSLKVDDSRPGLRTLDENHAEPVGPLLALEGVAEVGRWAPEALSGATLVGYERRFERVEATYAPPGWGELAVRAAWEPSGHDGVDLEIQMSALSVDRLKAVEVKLVSVLPERTTTRRRRWVEPRDVRSAGLSYDGREADARGLTTLPPAVEETLAPRVLPAPWSDGQSYVEMVPLRDVSRRITEGGTISSVGHTTRYGLFGHDLEKGVVLRARLRGLWTDSKAPVAEALEHLAQFLQEPLHLGT
jgi:hypothetical protein